jgi:hypothetical protein
MQRLCGANQRQLGMADGNCGLTRKGRSLRNQQASGARSGSLREGARALDICQFSGPGSFECGYTVDLASGIAGESSVQQFSNFRDFHGNLSTKAVGFQLSAIS